MFVCFPRLPFAKHPFSVAWIPTPLNQDCLLITMFSLLNPHHIQVQTQDSEWEKEKQKENSGDVIAVLYMCGKDKMFFDSPLHSKVCYSVLRVVSNFRDFRKIFHQCFMMLANSIQDECKLQRNRFPNFRRQHL